MKSFNRNMINSRQTHGMNTITWDRFSVDTNVGFQRTKQYFKSISNKLKLNLYL